jgi:hypothetical protein
MKMKELLVLIREVAFSKKVKLKKLQSLCGVLAFCTWAIPAGRAFSRRLYMATSKAKKPFELSIIKPKYSMTQVGPSVFSSALVISYIYL